MSTGTVVTIKDLVVRAQFDDDVPSVGELVVVDNGHNTKLLVDHLDPGGVAMCLNIRSDRRIQRGMSVQRTNRGIEIPVGDITIGRILDAIGDPLDGQPAIAGEDVVYKDILKIENKSTEFKVIFTF